MFVVVPFLAAIAASATGVVLATDLTSKGIAVDDDATIWAKGPGSATRTSPIGTLSVFSRAQAPEDKAPDEVREQVESLYPEGLPRALTGHPGEVAFERSRLVIRPSGYSAIRVFAFPTTEGWVCYGFSDDIGSGCVTELEHGISISISEGRDPEAIKSRGFNQAARMLVFGFTADDVETVEVMDAKGTFHLGRMGENAYLIELAPGSAIVGARVSYRNGSQARLRL